MAAIWHRFVLLSKMCESLKNIFWNWTKYFPFGKYWFSWKSCWVINNSLQTALNFSKTETTFVSMLEGVVSTLTCIDTTIINNSDNTHISVLSCELKIYLMLMFLQFAVPFHIKSWCNQSLNTFDATIQHFHTCWKIQKNWHNHATNFCKSWPIDQQHTYEKRFPSTKDF